MPELLLAHHPILTSLPFFAPVIIFAVGITMLAIRERRRREP